MENGEEERKQGGRKEERKNERTKPQRTSDSIIREIDRQTDC